MIYMGSGSNIHNSLAFLPWHREFTNRYELLLQQYDPTVKLLYWDWTTNPTTSLSFMGSLTGSIGAPFNPPIPPTLFPPPVSRGVSGSPPAEPDSTVLARSSYGPFTPFCTPTSPCPPAPPSTAPFMSALEVTPTTDRMCTSAVAKSRAPCGPRRLRRRIRSSSCCMEMLTGSGRNGSAIPRIVSPTLDPTQTYGASLGADENLSQTMAPWDGSPGAPHQREQRPDPALGDWNPRAVRRQLRCQETSH